VNIPIAKAVKLNQIHRKLDWHLLRNEKVFQEAVQKWFAFTIKQIQSDLQNKFAKDVTAELTDWEYLQDQGEEILKPATLSVMKDGGDAAYKLFLISGAFDVLNPEAVKAAKSFTANLVREVNNETRKGIRTYIATGIKEGKSMDKIARELRPLVGLTERQTKSIVNYRNLLSDKERYPELTADEIDKRVQKYAGKTHRRRTITIARTETARAQNLGYTIGMSDLGVEKLEFSAYEGCCPTCGEMNGRIYTLKEAKSLIPVHPNCRCALLPVVANTPVCRGIIKMSKAACIPPDQLRDRHIDDLLDKLAKAKSPADKRKIRRQLRKLGHKGGLKPRPKIPVPEGVTEGMTVEELMTAVHRTLDADERRKIRRKLAELGHKGGLSDMSRLPRYKTIEEWRKSFTWGDESAVAGYSTSEFNLLRKLEAAILSGKKKLSALTANQRLQLETIARLERLISTAPPVKGEIYRGMRFIGTKGKKDLARLEEQLANKEFTTSALTSFSKSRKWAEGFAGYGAKIKDVHTKVLFVVKKAPRRCADFTTVAANPEEQEVLVGAATRFRVLRKTTRRVKGAKEITYYIEPVEGKLPKAPSKPKVTPKPKPKPKPAPEPEPVAVGKPTYPNWGTDTRTAMRGKTMSDDERLYALAREGGLCPINWKYYKYILNERDKRVLNPKWKLWQKALKENKKKGYVKPTPIPTGQLSHKEVFKYANARQRFAVYQWQSEDFISEEMTKIQRGIKPVSSWRGKQASYYLPYLEQLVSHMPDYKGTVYRGMTLSRKQAAKMFGKKAKTWTAESFASTAKYEKQIKPFVQTEISQPDRVGVVMKIDLKSGAELGKFRDFMHRAENEVLIRKNTKFKIVSSKLKYDRKYGGDYWEVHLKELPAKAKLPETSPKPKAVARPKKVVAPDEAKPMPVKASGEKFTEADMRNIQDYTGPGYVNVNHALREGFEDPVKTKYYLKKADELQKSLLKLDGWSGTCYRGMYITKSNKKFFERTFVPGNIFKSKSFMSCSKSKKLVDERYPSDIRLIVKSKSGRDLTNLSWQKTEQEVLFPKGTSFKVDKVVGKNVYLTEL